LNYGQLLHSFVTDDKFLAAVIAVFVDFLLGIAASFRLGTFRVSYIADFMRNDVLFKLVPWFVLFAGAEVAGGADFIIPGLDMGVLATGVYVTIMAAWVGSIYSSLGDLGFNLPGTSTPPRAADRLVAPLDGETMGPPHG
jgi:hypothetical protein